MTVDVYRGRKTTIQQQQQYIWQKKLSVQSVPQDQKSVIFSHSVISLNQLLKTFKYTANIFLTFRNHVKIFFPQNILQNF